MSIKGRVLVTGGTGFLGSNLIKFMVTKGISIRALVRGTSDVSCINHNNVEIVKGNIADEKSLEKAFDGVDFLIHAAADTNIKKSNELSVNEIGAMNVIKLCEKFKIKKMIYISSLSVYGVSQFKNGDYLDEKSTLEEKSSERGIYSESKFKAEMRVREMLNDKSCSTIIIRPGIIWGPGGSLFNPSIGFFLTKRIFCVFGLGHQLLPLIFIDNLVLIIHELLDRKAISSGVYNAVDKIDWYKRDYINKILKRKYPKLKFVYIPNRFFQSIIALYELLINTINFNPLMTSYRFNVSQKSLYYSSKKVQDLLNDSVELIDMNSAVKKTLEMKS